MNNSNADTPLYESISSPKDDLSSFGIQIGVAVLFAILSFLIFLGLRKTKLFYHLYYARCLTQKYVSTPPPHIPYERMMLDMSFCDPEPFPPSSPFQLCSHVFNVPESYILQKLGMDAALFLRFHRLCVRLSFILAFTVGSIFIPVHVYFGQHAPPTADVPTTPNNTGASNTTSPASSKTWELALLNAFSILTVPNGHPVLYLHGLFTYLVTLLVLLLVKQTHTWYLRFLREEQLREVVQNKIHTRSVFVRGLPKYMRNETALADRLRLALPHGDIQQIWFCRRTARLERRIAKRNLYFTQLEILHLQLARAVFSRRASHWRLSPPHTLAGTVERRNDDDDATHATADGPSKKQEPGKSDGPVLQPHHSLMRTSSAVSPHVLEGGEPTRILKQPERRASSNDVLELPAPPSVALRVLQATLRTLFTYPRTTFSSKTPETAATPGGATPASPSGSLHTHLPRTRANLPPWTLGSAQRFSDPSPLLFEPATPASVHPLTLESAGLTSRYSLPLLSSDGEEAEEAADEADTGSDSDREIEDALVFLDDDNRGSTGPGPGGEGSSSTFGLPRRAGSALSVFSLPLDLDPRSCAEDKAWRERGENTVRHRRRSQGSVEPSDWFPPGMSRPSAADPEERGRVKSTATALPPDPRLSPQVPHALQTRSLRQHRDDPSPAMSSPLKPRLSSVPTFSPLASSSPRLPLPKSPTLPMGPSSTTPSPFPAENASYPFNYYPTGEEPPPNCLTTLTSTSTHDSGSSDGFYTEKVEGNSGEANVEVAPSTALPIIPPLVKDKHGRILPSWDLIFSPAYLPYLQPHLPTHPSKYFHGSTKLFTIDYLARKIRYHDALIDKMRNVYAFSENFRATSSAFVTFDSAHTAAIFSQCHVMAIPGHRLSVEPAPSPSDILWSSFALFRSKKRTVLRQLSHALIYVITFLWIFPVSIMVYLVNIDAITDANPALKAFLEQHKALLPYISYLLPSLMATVLGIIIPYIFHFLLRIQGYFRQSELERRLTNRYFFFLFFNYIFMISIGQAPLVSLINWVTFLNIQIGNSERMMSLDSLFRDATQAISRVSNFYINYITVQSLLHGCELIQINWGLFISFYTTMRSVARTPRQLEAAKAPFRFPYFYYWPSSMLILSITLLFALLQPLMLFVSALYFLYGTWVYKHQLLYCYVRTHESMGRQWSSVLIWIVLSLVIFQIVMAGVLASMQGYVVSVCISPLPWFTILVYFRWKAEAVRSGHYHLPLDVLSAVKPRAEPAERKTYFPPCLSTPLPHVLWLPKNPLHRGRFDLQQSYYSPHYCCSIATTTSARRSTSTLVSPTAACSHTRAMQRDRPDPNEKHVDVEVHV